MHYVVWVQYKSSQKNFNREWLVFAIRNVVSNEFLLIFFHYLMFINYYGKIY